MMSKLTKLTLLTLALLLTSCAPGKTDPELKPFVEKWEETCGEKVNMDVAMVDDMDGTAVGKCIKFFASGRIEISREMFERSSRYFIQGVVIHELAHCMRGRRHENRGEFIDGCPKTVVDPLTLSDYCMARHYDFYMKNSCERGE